MKEQYVRGLAEGQRVDSVFGLRARDVRSARTGDRYLSLELADRTGCIRGILFRPSAADESIPVGSVVRVRGTVTSFRGVRRLTVVSLGAEQAFDREDLIRSGPRLSEELIAQLRGLMRSVGDRGLRRLLNAVYGTPGFFERFVGAPATCDGHHAYLGGLLEHTVSVATLCASLAESTPLADRDLLVASALLHDVGVCAELSYETAVAVTDAGRLLGHVTLGDRLVDDAVRGLGAAIPPDRAALISHAILAHHTGDGPGAPRTLEAVLLQAADSLDAAASRFTGATAGAALLEERWTDSCNGFGRSLLVPAPDPGTATDDASAAGPERSVMRCA